MTSRCNPVRRAAACLGVLILGIACAPQTSLRRGEYSPRERAHQASVKNSMHIIQTALEAYAADHYGYYPPYDQGAFDPTNEQGFAPYMPGGNPSGKDGVPVLGKFPKNPYSGERYNRRPEPGLRDLLYGAAVLIVEEPGEIAKTWSGSPDCPYRNLRCPNGRPGTIGVAIYLDPDTGEVLEYGIIGWGLDQEQPVYEPDPDHPGEKRYFVLHN